MFLTPSKLRTESTACELLINELRQQTEVMQTKIKELKNSSQVENDKTKAQNRHIEDLKYKMDEMRRRQTNSNNIYTFN